MERVYRVWDSYLSLWKRLKGWKLFLLYLFHYTALFLLLQRATFSVFYETNKTFILRSDGMPNYFTGLVGISQSTRDGIQDLLRGEKWPFSLYNFRTGLVKPGLEIEPLQWLAVLCPWDKIDIFYDFLVLLRIYLIGVSFSVMGFYFKQRPLPILIGAISYAFSSYTYLAGIAHPFFMGPMILLPLLIICAEEVLKNRCSWLFSITVFICLISSLYFACMLAILIVIYLFSRYACVYSKNGLAGFVQFIGRVALWGGMGIMLSCLIAVPTLLQMLGTGRIGREVDTLLHYATTYYSLFVSRFIVVPLGAGASTHVGFSVLAIPAIVLLYTNRTKEAKSLKIIFALLTVMLWSPQIGYVMSGFNTISNRWSFAYALCVSAIIMVTLPELLTADRTKLALVGTGILAYVSVCYFVVARGYYHEEPLVLLFVATLLVSMCYVAGERGKKRILPLCLIITCLSSWYSSFLLFDTTRENYTVRYVNKGEPYSYLTSGQYASLKQNKIVDQDPTFFRVTGSNISREEINSSFYYGLNGLSYYCSIYFQPYRQLQEALETPQQGFNILNHGLGAGAPILSMYSVKYYAAKQNGHAVWPYGFEEVGQTKNGTTTDVILRNPYVLPVGFTYDKRISPETFANLNALEKQEAMLQGVVVENDTMLPEADVKNTIAQIPVEVVATEGLTWENGTLRVEKEKAKLSLSFKGAPNADTYLRVVNLDLTNGDASLYWLLTVNTPNTSNIGMFTSDGQLYNNGAKTQLLYLGNSPDGYTSCTLTFPQKGTFTLDDLEVYCQPMDHYAEQIELLRAEPLENVETNWRGLTGTISTSKDKFLCFSIPYDKGWTAYVDGKKAELVQANIGFMGVELSAGDHDIELKYCPLGMPLGAVFSCIGLVGVVALTFGSKKKRMSEHT